MNLTVERSMNVLTTIFTFTDEEIDELEREADEKGLDIYGYLMGIFEVGRGC